MARNDDERAQWVLNYEPLYRWFIVQPRRGGRSEPSMTRFVRENRAEIDIIIYSQLHRNDGRNGGTHG